MKRIALIAAVLSIAPGCSWMMSRPPTRYASGATLCSATYGAPVLDIISASTYGMLALAGLTIDEAHGDDGARTLGALSLVGAGLHAASSSYGFRQARACGELERSASYVPQLVPQVGPGPLPYAPAPVTVEPGGPQVIEEVIEEDVEVKTKTRTRVRTTIHAPAP